LSGHSLGKEFVRYYNLIDYLLEFVYNNEQSIQHIQKHYVKH
jgi:hypothetical protein